MEDLDTMHKKNRHVERVHWPVFQASQYTTITHTLYILKNIIGECLKREAKKD